MLCDFANHLIDILVFSGGSQNELSPLCDDFPRSLLMVCNKPLIWYCLKPWITFGCRTFFICIEEVYIQRLRICLEREFPFVRFIFVPVPMDKRGVSTTTCHAVQEYLRCKKSLSPEDPASEPRDAVLLSCDTILAGIDLMPFISQFYSNICSVSVLLHRPLPEHIVSQAFSTVSNAINYLQTRKKRGEASFVKENIAGHPTLKKKHTLEPATIRYHHKPYPSKCIRVAIEKTENGDSYDRPSTRLGSSCEGSEMFPSWIQCIIPINNQIGIESSRNYSIEKRNSSLMIDEGLGYIGSNSDDHSLYTKNRFSNHIEATKECGLAYSSDLMRSSYVYANTGGVFNDKLASIHGPSINGGSAKVDHENLPKNSAMGLNLPYALPPLPPQHFRLHCMDYQSPTIEMHRGMLARRPEIMLCEDLIDAHCYLVRKWVLNYIASFTDTEMERLEAESQAHHALSHDLPSTVPHSNSSTTGLALRTENNDIFDEEKKSLSMGKDLSTNQGKMSPELKTLDDNQSIQRNTQVIKGNNMEASQSSSNSIEEILSTDDFPSIKGFIIPSLAASQFDKINIKENVFTRSFEKLEIPFHLLLPHWSLDTDSTERLPLFALNASALPPPSTDAIRVFCTVYEEELGSAGRVIRIQSKQHYEAMVQEIMSAKLMDTAIQKGLPIPTHIPPVINRAIPNLLQDEDLITIKAREGKLQIRDSICRSIPLSSAYITRSVIGNNVRIHNGARITDSVVMDNAEIGKFAVIEDSIICNAFIEEQSIIKNEVVGPGFSVTSLNDNKNKVSSTSNSH